MHGYVMQNICTKLGVNMSSKTSFESIPLSSLDNITFKAWFHFSPEANAVVVAVVNQGLGSS